MTTTYRRTQPVHQPLMKDTFYSDYDVERGISKRVNCLVALTVVALIVGGAALGLSVMILMQGMDASARREAEVTTLQLRVKQLERQSGMPSPTQEVLGAAPPSSEDVEPPQEMFPTIDEEPPQEMGPTANEELPQEMGPTVGEEATVSAGHPYHDQKQPDVEEGPPGSGAGAGEEDGLLQDKDTLGLGAGDGSPVLPPNPNHLDDDDDDDDDGYGSGDCPVLPRPVCPIGMTVCYTKDQCPVPVCCNRL